MKVWHIAALLLIVAAGIFIGRGSSSSDRTEAMIDKNCALFYGSAGPEAENDCRVQMRRRHDLPGSEEAAEPPATPSRRFQN